jgi:hypothetical protein
MASEATKMILPDGVNLGMEFVAARTVRTSELMEFVRAWQE